MNKDFNFNFFLKIFNFFYLFLVPGCRVVNYKNNPKFVNKDSTQKILNKYEKILIENHKNQIIDSKTYKNHLSILNGIKKKISKSLLDENDVFYSSKINKSYYSELIDKLKNTSNINLQYNTYYQSQLFFFNSFNTQINKLIFFEEKQNELYKYLQYFKLFYNLSVSNKLTRITNKNGCQTIVLRYVKVCPYYGFLCYNINHNQEYVYYKNIDMVESFNSLFLTKTKYCLICSELFSNSEYYKQICLCCNHIYHLECLNKFNYLGKLHCPICKKNHIKINNIKSPTKKFNKMISFVDLANLKVGDHVLIYCNKNSIGYKPKLLRFYRIEPIDYSLLFINCSWLDNPRNHLISKLDKIALKHVKKIKKINEKNLISMIICYMYRKIFNNNPENTILSTIKQFSLDYTDFLFRKLFAVINIDRFYLNNKNNIDYLILLKNLLDVKYPFDCCLKMHNKLIGNISKLNLSFLPNVFISFTYHNYVKSKIKIENLSKNEPYYLVIFKKNKSFL